MDFIAPARDFSRFNTVLYAHNMADGSMFGALRNYADRDFFMAHREIILYTPSAEYHYRVFAATIFPVSVSMLRLQPSAVRMSKVILPLSV